MDKHDALSFKNDILPLFRQVDIDHMKPMDVPLDDYAWMSDEGHAKQVYDYLTGAEEPRMPPGGPYWSDSQLETYSRWMDEGRKP